jgi:hypothetical protein
MNQVLATLKHFDNFNACQWRYIPYGASVTLCPVKTIL